MALPSTMSAYREMDERYRYEQHRAEMEARLRAQQVALSPFPSGGGLGGGLMNSGFRQSERTVVNKTLIDRLLISDSDTGIQVLQKETDKWLEGVLDT